MTSRKRKHSSIFSLDASRSSRFGSTSSSRATKRSSRKKRQHLLESLESRQLLAGPQLIGIQPNDGELIVNGTIRDTAPRVLTLRFDANQQIDASTLDGIQITRSGNDNTFGTADDVRIVPGLVTLGDPAPNEVVVRFAERLPDDNYRIEVFGFDDAGLGITGLRNQNGELLQPSVVGQCADVIDFSLRLGALVESIVPQPVVRLNDGSLVQNRNEIVVYFNEDPLFVEDDSAEGRFGNGTEEVTVTADIARSFDNVTINFVFNPAPGLTTAVHDPVARTITVGYRANSNFDSVVSAIDALDGFAASLSAGSGTTVFTAPAVQTTVRGNPTERSAENPRFYQLLLTQETVRTTDDIIYSPTEVVYDPTTFTARLFFDSDINELPGVPVGGGTFRLRIGTAVDDRVDLILPPTEVPVAASAVTDFQYDGLRVSFFSRTLGESASGRQIRFENTGAGGLTARLDSDGTVVFDVGGTSAQVQDLGAVVSSTPSVNAVIGVTWERDGVAGDGGTLVLPGYVIGTPPLVLYAVGDTFETALNVGIFGQFNALKSVVFSESIDPQPFAIELPGGDDDPAHSDEVDHINPAFGADTTDGITEIAYNFNGIFDTDFAGNSFLNQITERQKTRIREALNLWASEIGVQFRETKSEGITFAVGDSGKLQNRPGIPATNVSQLNARLRIDPSFNQSAMVFTNQIVFGTAYGEDFTRKAVAGIGLMLGLNATPDLPPPTIMSLNSGYLNASIDVLTDLEPVFPNNYDVLHGQYVHRTDSVDIDMYRFEVDLNDADKVGTLTAETFAERLPDSSLLDTSLTLFEEVTASVSTDFGVGADLAVTIKSLLPGRLGNNSRLDFIQTDRGAGDTAVRILRAFDASGNPVSNGIIVDLPRRGPNVSSVSAGAVVAAINNDPFASSIFRATITTGDAAIDISGGGLSFSPVLLRGGGLVQLSRNDNYFGEDSRIVASLGEGVYYIGVAASGNEQYDPTIPGSGYGGRTQGLYDLHLKFEPQVDEVDVIRDLDSDRIDVPGTGLDGDGDGVPGGANNFWFQTRPLNRVVEFIDNGDAITPGQTITIVGGSGVTRTYEFVPNGATPRPGNIAVAYNPGTSGFPTPSFILANQLAAQVNSRQGETGVSIAPTPGTSNIVFSGERSISFSTNFRGVEVFGRNLFVDKTAGPLADGSLDRPFNNITNPIVANAFGSALENDIVRIVGNGGSDNDITTEADNFSYQIGVSDTGGQTLEDGRNMEVPRGVTTMIDAGTVVKLRNSFIGIGSSTVQVDRSGGALQVLGTPRLVQLSAQGDPVSTNLVGGANVVAPAYDDGSVIFTSTRDRVVDTAAAGASAAASSGNWGGLIYRRDVDQAQGRRDLEDEGIFLQRVNHAEIRYGGGSSVLIDSVQQLVNPIQIVNMRPTITFNEITQSADSAISAAPNSFEETSYQAPRYQQAGAFTADYDRVGPDIHNNQLVNNSINGLFIRATTTPTESPKQFTVAGRFDDVDIVHYVAENLIVAAAPGGSIQDGFSPTMSLVSAQSLPGGTLVAGDYLYKMTFVDRDGFESLASTDTFPFTVAASNSSIQLTSLPQVVPGGAYLSRRLYRATAGPNPEYRLVADLDGSTRNFTDRGAAGDSVLDLTRQGVRGRLDASLVMDPGLIMKFRGTRIELGQGTQLLAEGLASDPVVFTSSLNDEFGAGGTFDTNNDNGTATGAIAPSRGNWSGIYAGPTSNVSFDHVELSYAGGISLLEGGLARGFLPLELQQAEGRITNSRFAFNDDGQDGAGPAGRFGRLAVTPATIMVRGSQPIIVGNTFVDNHGSGNAASDRVSIIDIDIESMGANIRKDIGRQTGDIDRIAVLDDNHGPLIRFNRYLNDPTSGIQLSGLEIRAGMITTATVFDDTDIAHLLFDNIEVGNFHSSGGLRLLSRPDESLVVKFAGSGTPNSATFGTGITASGASSGIDDRVGGMVHVIGLPGAPVILTSINDDTAGAGLKPDGSQFTDHDGDGTNSRPFANDWRGLLFDQFSNDFNMPVLPELELSTEVAPGLNSTVDNAQFLGELAQNLSTGDHVRRLGFEVDGYLSGANDIDVYSFIGSPGTQVWIDVDTTTFTLDTVIELLDENGNVLARSDNSFAETALTNPAPVAVFDPDLQGVTTSLQAAAEQYTARGVGGLYEDFGSTNPRDAGIHFRLAGNTTDPNARSVYFFRIRSASSNPDDAQGGITGGSYRFQARLTEQQAFPGSVVRYADIRYANNGIHVQGLMASSPLLGEAQENEAAAGNFVAGNDTVIGATPGEGAQYVGNLVNGQSSVISVGGELSSTGDVDFYQFEINYANGSGIQSTVFDIDYADGFNRPNTNISVFYDRDGVPPFESSPNFEPQLVFFGRASNIADDLTSPNGENSALEKLIRGSISNGDPFVGPVILPEGTYYVAITADGTEPFSLAAALVEPINSVDRIVEDRVDRVNPESPSTANGPVLPRLFSDAVLAGTDFTIVNDAQGGHGKPQHFDGTTGPVVVSTAPRIPETVAAGGVDASNGVSTVLPFSGDLDLLNWSIADDFEIGGAASFFGGAPNTSTTIPHVSINGNLRSDPADFYQIVLGAPSRVILDVDNGYDASRDRDTDNDPTTPPVNTDPATVDTDLIILEPDPTSPGSLRIVNPGRTLTSSIADGRGGSNSTNDPFIDTTLPAGVYFIGVLEEGTTLTFSNTGVTSANSGLSANTQSYTLHVSVEDHALPPGVGMLTQGASVISFDRAANIDSGSVTSEPFDLAGYVPADLPFLYVNRLYQPQFGDSARLRVTSDQNPVGSVLHTFTAGGWDQLRLSLAGFAGHTGIQLQVEYTTNGLPGLSTAVGLRLDDFIVGFAERGETVFNASTGATFTGGGFGGVSGEYQLEMRLGTDFATPTFGGNVRLDASFDTNDRHNQSVTLVAPDGTQISDGDTFILGDGAANQMFEFTTTPGTVAFGNTPVLFSATDTAAQVASSIRLAINNQNIISLEAASSGGLDTQPTTDGRLALSGSANGTFLPVASALAAPPSGTPLTTDANGNLLMPAILHNGTGDENYLRTQGQVIVEHNVISDVRGIGIWSEPGARDSSPNLVRNNSLLELPPVGNSYPGAVRNLPTLNDSVLGGLAPGIVIQNNTIDQAEYAGIKIDGQIAPLTIETGDGDTITDGSMFAIDAAGTRVVFEFEDIGQGVIPSPQRPVFGSATDGGDGVRDGHVPVYYRQTDSNPSSVYLGRVTAYTPLEVLHAIREAIQGSILVTNGLVELLDVYVGPSLTSQAPSFGGGGGGGGFFSGDENFATPALYLEGASAIYSFDAEIFIDQAPVYEAPQPFARIVNNTIYGSDGRESAFPDNALNSEPNDFLSQAVDTKIGSSHRDPYRQAAILGDNSGPLPAAGDVDFYRVYLEVGDRLIADIDTLDANAGAGTPAGPDTVLQIFDSSGIVQTFLDAAGNPQTLSDNAIAPGYLEPLSSVANVQADANNTRDPFIDFTATKTGVYYVGVSSAGNDGYDARSLSGRVAGTGGTGDYTISLEAYTPRSFVMSLNNGSGSTRNPSNYGAESDRGGSMGAQLIGTTFTVTQISDIPATRPAGNGTNQVTFVFTTGGPAVQGGNVAVPLETDYRVPDIMRAIESAITRVINNIPVLPNGGPIPAAEANALGGASGAGADLFEFTQLYFQDFNSNGFGHNRSFTAPISNLSDGAGTTEQYVFVEKVAEIEISAAAAAAGLSLDPQPGRDTDQLINETGVMVAGGASPTLLNNVFLNLHESLVREETRQLGFGPDNRGPDQQPKPMEVIVVGSVFQHDETALTQFNADMVHFALRDSGITTLRAPSNVNGGTDDFNLTLGNVDQALQYPEGNNFQPDFQSVLIDSSVNSLVERSALVNLKNSVGLPISNIVAPNLDVSGILRADNPNYAPPGGIGSSVFKDRGSSELADFVGPVAIAEVPRDNDAEGIDSDPSISYINLTGGVYEEFRIQLRDTGDASDPFAGIGIDDSTVVVPAIPGLRPSGAELTLFENDRLLIEGIDYVFNFDETKNIITLTPLAGVWKNDRSYRIALNNRDRAVLVAPDPSEVNDGDQIAITDTQGGTVVFEFESGYQLLVPEPITLVIPRVGTNAGGLSDGDIFQINDGENPVVVFEFNRDTAKLPGTVEVTLPSSPTPTNETDLKAFLNQIAMNVASAIQSQADQGLLNVDVRVLGNRVVVGAEPSVTAITSGSGLQQLSRTLALQVPEDGVAATGIRDGDTFILSNGNATVTFEFDTGNGLNTPTNIIVPVLAADPAANVVLAVQQAIAQSPLGLNPQLDGLNVYLNLPVNGSAVVPAGQLTVVGLSRTATDGDTIVITPNTGLGQDVTLEINRTDEPNPIDGTPMDDGVTDPNVPINITRATTSDELTALIANLLQGSSIPGLNANDIQTIPGGLLAVGGEQGLGFAVSGTSLEVTGAPDVTGSSTIQVFGPLLLQLPLVGGGNIDDGSVLILTDTAGNDVLFEFNLNGTLTTVVGAIPVRYNTFDTVDVLADNLVLAINNAAIGITAQNLGTGRVSLGRIDASRVNTGGIPDLTNPLLSIPGVPQITTRRGIVSDGEVLTIRQGSTSVSFEFESVNNGGGVAPGNIAVAFQPGSTVGDVAISLAAAINNNRGSLRISAQAEFVAKLDVNGDPVLDDDGNVVMVPSGQVLLDDLPGTVVDVTAAPTLNVTGVPGGAIPVRISPAFSATEVKRALLNAFNSVNEPGELPVTTLSAEDRGGATFFVENGEIFAGPLANYFLPAIKDLAGNVLEANRDDLTTQFTILMPTVSLDFGDAPDPVLQVAGRYPTLNANDGARNVVDNSLKLGRFIDADPDGRPVRSADGDDLSIEIFGTGALFTSSVINGAAEIVVHSPSDPLARDGDTVTINTGIAVATVEFDVNGRFNEDNFAVRAQDPTSAIDIADAIIPAIQESPLRPAALISGFRLLGSNSVQVTVNGASSLLTVDEFSTSKVLQLTRGVDSALVEGGTFTITVAGQQARFEFDTDGSVSPGNIPVTPLDTTSRDSIANAIRNAIAGSALGTGGLSLSQASLFVVADDEDGVSLTSQTNPHGVLNKGVITPISVTVTGAGVLEAWIDFNADGDWTDPGEQIITPLTDGAIFSDAGVGITRVFNVTVPATTPNPIAPIQTYARFRVSRDGGLEPSGLALSGETEDYVMLILPGGPPQIANPNRTFTVEEDRALQALDENGVLTPSNTNDDGLLTGVVDLQGDDFVIFADDVGVRTLTTPGGTVAGELDLASDGTFTFIPAADFNGVTGFTARVSDVKPFDRSAELVNSVPISVTINVVPVNDPPVAQLPSVVITRNINEDVVQTFSIDNEFVTVNGSLVFFPGLIAGNYVPGPQNESTQPMVIQSVGSIRGEFLSSLGGMIAITDNGTNVVYTPPADYNGSIADTFTYVVADVPGAGQQSEAATKLGTVSISFNAVNDPPRLINDNYSVQEDTLLQIPVLGDSVLAGILDNDTAGPADEVAAGQTISLVAGQFPKTTFRGGTVSLSGNTLTYDPPALFSGIDQFEYSVVDNLGASATATVSINIGGVNNGPIFVGINGVAGQTDIVRDESKQDPQQATYDLTTWFEDPEGDALTFAVTSSNSTIVPARVVGDLLVLDFPPFAFTPPGQPVSLSITAEDSNGAMSVIQIPVTVVNTPDPPSVIGTLNPLSGTEDLPVTGDLGSVFADPDGEPLHYSVARLGNIINPTAQQILQHPLVRSITFVGDQLQITLEPNQSGEVEIEIAATDNSFRVSDTFTLTVSPVPDRPVALADGYNVPVGAKLQILNPSSGLLRNDSDADGDPITVDLASIVGPNLGTLEVNADGTFVYTNTTGNVNDQDSFSYRILDNSGLASDQVTVTLTLNQSRYQNPLTNLSTDVNADGVVSAIDALRIINFLSRALVGSTATFVPVSAIGTPPPDYYDTSGDGRVSALDALLVINRLSQIRAGEGESLASHAVTTSFAAASTANLAVRNSEPSTTTEAATVTEPASSVKADPRDALLAAGLEINDSASEIAIEQLPSGSEVSTPSGVDEALSLLMDEMTHEGPLG